MKQAIVPKIGFISSYSHSVHENQMFAEKLKGKTKEVNFLWTKTCSKLTQTALPTNENN
jgi:hypothetical protein